MLVFDVELPVKNEEKEPLKCRRMHIWALKTQKFPGALRGPWILAANGTLRSCDSDSLCWQLSASEAGVPPWPNPGSAPGRLGHTWSLPKNNSGYHYSHREIFSNFPIMNFQVEKKNILVGTMSFTSGSETTFQTIYELLSLVFLIHLFLSLSSATVFWVEGHLRNGIWRWPMLLLIIWWVVFNSPST